MIHCAGLLTFKIISNQIKCEKKKKKKKRKNVVLGKKGKKFVY